MQGIFIEMQGILLCRCKVYLLFLFDTEWQNSSNKFETNPKKGGGSTVCYKSIVEMGIFL